MNALVRAPAKINLRLKVVGKRADGYHLLSMLNARVSLSDELRFSIIEEGGVFLTVTSPGGAGQTESPPTGLERVQDNLIFKSASLYLDRAGIKQGVRIELAKHIPMGAGLGGGSSDAATTLLALNEIFEAFNESHLLQLASEIGSDVPFFIVQSTALVNGVGEEVKRLPLEVLQGQPVMLIYPNEHSSTPEVFKRFHYNPSNVDIEEERRRLSALSACVASGSAWSEVLSLVDNDLQAGVLVMSPRCRELAALLDQAEGTVWSMTGSGSAFFVLSQKWHESESFFNQINSKLPDFCTTFRATIL